MPKLNSSGDQYVWAYARMNKSWRQVPTPHIITLLPLILAIFHQLLAWLPPHAGGLLPIGFGLFHQQESIREITVDFLNTLKTHNVSYLDIVPP